VRKPSGRRLTSWRSAATNHSGADQSRRRRNGRPNPRQGQDEPGTRPLLAAEPLRSLRQSGVVRLSEGLRTKIKRRLERRHKLFFLQPCLLPLPLWKWRCPSPSCTADIRLDHMGNESANSHYIRSELVVELVGRHRFNGCKGVCLAHGQDVSQRTGDGILGRRRRCLCYRRCGKHQRGMDQMYCSYCPQSLASGWCSRKKPFVFLFH